MAFSTNCFNVTTSPFSSYKDLSTLSWFPDISWYISASLRPRLSFGNLLHFAYPRCWRLGVPASRHNVPGFPFLVILLFSSFHIASIVLTVYLSSWLPCNPPSVCLLPPTEVKLNLILCFALISTPGPRSFWALMPTRANLSKRPGASPVTNQAPAVEPRIDGALYYN